MKNLHFRFLAILVLTLVVLSLIFSGCKSSTASTTNSSSSAAANASTPKATNASAVSPLSDKSTPAASETPQYGGTLTLLLGSSPGGNIGWPPEFLGGDSTSPQMMYEGLMTGMRDSSYQPSLAESWELAADKLSATYHLRKGIKFHDGTDFNAQAVKFNFDYLISGKRQVYWDHVEVVDDYTVKVYFKEYRNGILYTVAGQWIASPTAAQKGGSLDYIRKNPCGTGPFMFVSFQQDVSLVTKKNPNYWVKGKPYLDGFVIKYVPDVMTQKAVMQKGEADAIPVELGKAAKDYIDLNFKVLTQHQAIYSLFMDSANTASPLANEKVREAIEYAIDRKTITKGLGYGLFNAPNNIIAADNVAAMPNFVGRDYDSAKAKQLLIDAGYPNGFKTQITPHPSADRDILLAVKQYLDAIGIQTTLNIVPETQYLQMRAGTYDGMIMEPFASFANFGTSLSMYLDQKSIFFPHMAKPDALQAFLDKIAHSPTYPDVGLIQAMVQYIYDNALIIPVHDGGMGYAISSKVRGNGFLTLSFPPYFQAENLWLVK